MAMEYVQICKNFVSHVDGSISCSAFSYTQAYLISPDESGYIDLFLRGGFDSESFAVGFGGALLCWAIGVSFGLVASVMRKCK